MIFGQQIKIQNLKEAANIFRALNHPLRQRLLKFIDEQGEVPVSPIYKSLNIEQSVTSQHLKILREAAVVNTRREGRKILYSVNYERVAEVMELAKKI